MNWPDCGDPRLPERFWDKVHVEPGGCWIWAGAVCSSGFGQYRLANKLYAAHKVAFDALVGEVVSGRMSQTCSIKVCCNPRHQRLAGNSKLRRPTLLFASGDHNVVWRRVLSRPSPPKPALPPLTVSQGVRVVAHIDARSRALMACVVLAGVLAAPDGPEPAGRRRSKTRELVAA